MATKKRGARKTPVSDLKVNATQMTVVTYKEHGHPQNFTISPSREVAGGVKVEGPCGDDVDMRADVARAVARAILAVTGE